MAHPSLRIPTCPGHVHPLHSACIIPALDSLVRWCTGAHCFAAAATPCADSHGPARSLFVRSVPKPDPTRLDSAPCSSLPPTHPPPTRLLLPLPPALLHSCTYPHTHHPPAHHPPPINHTYPSAHSQHSLARAGCDRNRDQHLPCRHSTPAGDGCSAAPNSSRLRLIEPVFL